MIKVIFHRYTVPTVNQTGTSGYITSLNYPNNYTKLDLREYYITAPSTSYTVRTFIALLTFKKSYIANLIK